MRESGVSYAKIASFLDLNANTVKTWCRRNTVTPDPLQPQVVDPVGVWCRNCAVPLEGERPAKFCSEACRRSWWNGHSHLTKRAAFYEFTCVGCGERFTAYGNKHRKYCSHPCYIRSRFATRGGRR